MSVHKAAFIVVLLCIAGHCAAKTIYVDVNGPNDPGTGSYEDPFLRIQHAIDSADNNDTIVIAAGIYTNDPNNRNIDPNGLAITIRSTDPNDPNVVAATIIDPNQAGRGLYFHSNEDANCIISGLTIRNGHAANSSGGGIYCWTSSPTISNCIITNNTAKLYGGGILVYYSSPDINSCIISNNSATVGDGGGLECRSGNPKITNCVIANNQAYGNGGGIECYDSGNATLTNCTIVGNSADTGGALCCVDSQTILKNSILWANDANKGNQVALVSFGSNPSTSISYSDLQGGQTAIHDPCEGVVWGVGNIDTDPCFAVFDPNSNPNIWDFHLQSAYGRWDPNNKTWVTDSNTSACIDAGDPNSDWEDEPWPNGRCVNIGAYGGTNQASKNGNIADFNIDGLVSFADFAEFSNKWSAHEICVEDLSNNGVVDFVDLCIFTQNWLWQRQ